MMLSDFKDEKAVEVISKLLIPIGNIARNKSCITEAKDSGTIVGFASAMLKHNREDTLDILAILNGKERSDYHFTAATLIADVINMTTDPEMLPLFGLQMQTSASSGSASESGEATVE